MALKDFIKTQAKLNDFVYIGKIIAEYCALKCGKRNIIRKEMF